MPARGYRKDAAGNFVRTAEAEAIEVEEYATLLSLPTTGQGVEAFELPRSTVTKIAKASLPATSRIQKDANLAIAKGATVFINYLCTFANDTATSRNQKTITVDHIFESLKDLEWGEADTEALRKDLKRQLRAFRYNARMKKEAKAKGQTWVPPGSSVADKASKGKGPAQESQDAEGAPEVDIHLNPGKSLPSHAANGNGTDGDQEDEDEDGIPVSFDDDAEQNDGLDDGAEESPFEDETDAMMEDDGEDEAVDEEEDGDPNDFEDEMGNGLEAGDGRDGRGSDAL